MGTGWYLWSGRMLYLGGSEVGVCVKSSERYEICEQREAQKNVALLVEQSSSTAIGQTRRRLVHCNDTRHTYAHHSCGYSSNLITFRTAMSASHSVLLWTSLHSPNCLMGPNGSTHIVETLTALPAHLALFDHLLQHRNRLHELFTDSSLLGLFAPAIGNVRGGVEADKVEQLEGLHFSKEIPVALAAGVCS